MSQQRSITIHAPATVANMVCGFDVLGFAVNDPYDIMKIRFSDQPGITIVNEDAYNLPLEPEKNVAGAALLALLEEAKGLPWNAVWDYFCLTNNVPIGDLFIKEVQQYERNITYNRG